MARMVVQYPLDVAVMVDGQAAGRTNRAITLASGSHTIALEGELTEPATQTVVVDPGGAAADILRPRFAPADPPLDRFSPLYCLYNGVLLGQCVSLSFASGRP